MSQAHSDRALTSRRRKAFSDWVNSKGGIDRVTVQQLNRYRQHKPWWTSAEFMKATIANRITYTKDIVLRQLATDFLRATPLTLENTSKVDAFVTQYPEWSHQKLLAFQRDRQPLLSRPKTSANGLDPLPHREDAKSVCTLFSIKPSTVVLIPSQIGNTASVTACSDPLSVPLSNPPMARLPLATSHIGPVTVSPDPLSVALSNPDATMPVTPAVVVEDVSQASVGLNSRLVNSSPLTTLPSLVDVMSQSMIPPARLWPAPDASGEQQLFQSERLSTRLSIFVKLVNGGYLAIDVEPTDTVGTVKRKIHARQGIEPDVQQLLFAGQVLEDDMTLTSYDIRNEYTLCLTISLKPSPVDAKSNKNQPSLPPPPTVANDVFESDDVQERDFKRIKREIQQLADQDARDRTEMLEKRQAMDAIVSRLAGLQKDCDERVKRTEQLNNTALELAKICERAKRKAHIESERVAQLARYQQEKAKHQQRMIEYRRSSQLLEKTTEKLASTLETTRKASASSN